MESTGAKLLRSGSVKTASTAVVALLGLASSAVLARGLDQDGLGLFALVLAVVQIGVMLADGGTGLATTRFLAAAGGEHGRRHALRSGLRARLLTTIIVIALGATLMPWLLQILFHGGLSRPAYLWALALIAVKSLFLFAPAVARGRLEWKGEGVLLALEAVGILAVYASLHLWQGTLDDLLLRLTAIYVLLIVPAWLWLASCRSAQAGAAEPAADEPAITLRRIYTFGLPLVLNSSFFLLLTWTDRVMIGMLCSPAELAVYFIAANLAGAGRVLFSIPEQVLYSHLAAGTRAGDPALPDIHARIFRLFASLGTLFVVVAGAAGTFVIPLMYGADYQSSVWPFQLLLIVLLVRVVSIPASLLLICVHERTAETRDALGFAFVLNVLVNAILIPRLGLSGAILGSLVAFLAATLYLWWSLWKVGRLRAGAGDLAACFVPAALWLAVVGGAHRHLLPGWAAWAAQALLAAWLGWQALRQVSLLGRIRFPRAVTT